MSNLQGHLYSLGYSRGNQIGALKTESKGGGSSPFLGEGHIFKIHTFLVPWNSLMASRSHCITLFFSEFCIHSGMCETKNVQRNGFSAGVTFSSAFTRSSILCQKFWGQMNVYCFKNLNQY